MPNKKEEKKTTKKTVKKSSEKKTVKKTVSKDRYTEGVGRRKSSVARVRITKASAGKVVVTVNEKKIEDYFKLPEHVEIATSPLKKLDLDKSYSVSVKVVGSGLSAQSEAVRLGLARAIIKEDETLKKKLKVFGYLTRDPRVVERKKYGLRKARRAPQWSKR